MSSTRSGGESQIRVAIPRGYPSGSGPLHPPTMFKSDPDPARTFEIVESSHPTPLTCPNRNVRDADLKPSPYPTLQFPIFSYSFLICRLVSWSYYLVLNSLFFNVSYTCYYFGVRNVNKRRFLCRRREWDFGNCAWAKRGKNISDFGGNVS